MRRALPLILALAVIGATAGSAWADYTGPRPKFQRDQVWFHCNGDTKLYNANILIAGLSPDAYVPWDRTPPAASVATGAGCGGWDAGWVTNELYDVVYEGTFTGNLKSMTIELYDFILNQAREGTTQRMRIYGEIDGEPIFPQGDPASGAYTGRAFTVTPARVNSGATDRFQFTVTNLGYANEIYDAQGKLIDIERGGMALEDGPGTAEHTLRLLIGIDDFPAGAQRTGNDLWVWDTTEVPAGITFNPATPAAATVEADLPPF